MSSTLTSDPDRDIVHRLTTTPGMNASEASGPPARPLLQLRGITKRYGSLVACDHVDLEVRAGEIVGLLGQNGAGKSTLMKVVIGAERADHGEVLVDGQPLKGGDPAASASAGVGMVHQHFSLVGRLAVWQNVVLGEHIALDRDAAIARVESIAERYGLDVDPLATVDELSAGQRQRVEIIKCLRADPKVVILDEPTSVLTQVESRRLFEVLRGLVEDHGRAAILISHRLEEILHATDRVTVLRAGRSVAAEPTAACDAASLAAMMLGRDLEVQEDAAGVGLGTVEEPPGSDRAATGRVVLAVRGLRAEGEAHQPLLDGLDLQVAAGEIVGIAGVEGNGQDPLVDVLSGLLRPRAGELVTTLDDGREVPLPLDRLGVIPADRHDSGCVLDMSVAENLVLNDLDSVTRRRTLRRRLLDDVAMQRVAEFDISVVDIHAPMWTLSGGNQQKVVLARELARRPDVIVAAQPTRGLDIGAMEYMWTRLRQEAERGTAVLLVSTELDEIMALAHRILVIYRGRIIGEMPRHELDVDRLGLLMGGTAA